MGARCRCLFVGDITAAFKLSNIAFIKTHKTASTTFAFLLYRYARRHNVKVSATLLLESYRWCTRLVLSILCLSVDASQHLLSEIPWYVTPRAPPKRRVHEHQPMICGCDHRLCAMFGVILMELGDVRRMEMVAGEGVSSQRNLITPPPRSLSSRRILLCGKRSTEG